MGAAANTLLATNMLLDFLLKAQQVSMALQRAQTEGRDLTDDELLSFVHSDDAARARLQAAIDARAVKVSASATFKAEVEPGLPSA